MRRLSAAHRYRSSGIGLSGDHNGSARTAQLGEIAIGCHANLKPWALAPNDRTIGIRLQECILQASSSGTSAVAWLAELALMAKLRKCPCLLERCGAQNVDACGHQF